jgi:hypothetical protein
MMCVVCTAGEECFDVNTETGVVRTRCAPVTVGGARALKQGHEYEIGVSAVDVRGEGATPQKSPTQSLKIFVGERDPQFHELQYIASVPEHAPKQFE